MSEEEESGFLSRWSRRKQAVVRGEPVPELPPAIPLAEEPPPPVEAVPAPEPEPEFDVASLPPIESLDAGSDFTVFLQRGVPEALRSAALRKAWLADPLIRDYMSPLDYAWDFNTPGGLPNGFASTLAETGEALRKLISQAIGEIQPDEEPAPGGEAAPEQVLSAEIPLLPDAEALAEAPPALPLPELPLRLTDAAPDAARPIPEMASEPPPRRRHGGALPV